MDRLFFYNNSGELVKSKSGVAALLVIGLFMLGAQTPDYAIASDGQSDLVFNGTELVPHFENGGASDAVISVDANPSGSKTLRTRGNHVAVFQAEELKSEGVALGSLADDHGLTLAFHVEKPENVQILIDGVPFPNKGDSQIKFKPLEQTPANIQILSTRDATPAEVHDDFGRLPSSGIPIQHIASVSLDLGSLKNEAQRIGKFGRAVVQPTVTTVRNVTFIPEDWVYAPPLGCSSFVNYDFKGDGRSWSTSSSAFRTKFDVTIDWNGGPSFASTRTVGQTSLWHNVLGNRILEQTATASNSSMVLTTISKTSGEVKFKTYQDVTNPICIDLLTNGIFFNLNWSVSRLGSYSVQGTYMPVPNHEAYISSSSSSSWVTVFQTVHQSYYCLTGGVAACTTTRANSGSF
jgi:hypothetical protein